MISNQVKNKADKYALRAAGIYFIIKDINRDLGETCNEIKKYSDGCQRH